MVTLNDSSLDWALNHINKYNDTDIFPRPFEFDAINNNWKKIKEKLKHVDLANMKFSEYRTAVTAKGLTGFRIATQFDPIDSILLNAILYEISETIERCRVDKNLEIVHSYRLKPLDDGTLYDKEYSWSSFVEKARQMSSDNCNKYVIVTDIADFYSSIYLHNIETVLEEAFENNNKITHVQTLIKIIKSINRNQTHRGLPIGPQFSRAIAEIILNELDLIMISNNIKYIRYVDDYRIFCTSEAEAYKILSIIAQKFYEIRNLKLNEHKTFILPIHEFKKEYLEQFKDIEKNRIINEFYDLCERIGISTNIYEDVDFDDLNIFEKEELQKLNIYELLEEELAKSKSDFGMLNFLLKNLARFDNTDVADLLLTEKNKKKIYPIIFSFVQHLERVRSFSNNQKHDIGKKIMTLFNSSFITELPVNRAWLLQVFTHDDEWDNKDKFLQLYKKYQDNMTKRELILSLSKSKNLSFFREYKMQIDPSYDSWCRRAFLLGMSCLPKNERDPWYKSEKNQQRTDLEEIIIEWAQKYPL